MDHPNGSTSVYHGEGDDIDAETPAVLSPEQLQRHINAVAAHLEAAGYVVRPGKYATDNNCDLVARTSNHAHTAKIYLDDDRGATWQTWNELDEGTPSTRIATHIAHTLGNGLDDD